MPTQAQYRKQNEFWGQLSQDKKNRLITTGEYDQPRTLPDIGTRVIAFDGLYQNQEGLTARHPKALPSVYSLYGHLCNWKKSHRTPWVSTLTAWSTTLERILWHRAHGATKLSVIFFDLRTAGTAMSAASFADTYGLEDMEMYHDEFLYYKEIPKHAVFAVIDHSRDMQIDLHGSIIEVPWSLGKGAMKAIGEREIWDLGSEDLVTDALMYAVLHEVRKWKARAKEQEEVKEGKPGLGEKRVVKRIVDYMRVRRLARTDDLAGLMSNIHI